MSLNRVVVLAILFGALAVAMPGWLPGLIQTAQTSIQADDQVAAPADRRAPPVIEAARDIDRQDTGMRRLSGRQVALSADQRGHYQADARINGRTVEMMVDTGATTVALTAASARRLGISLSRSDYSVKISTANGNVEAAPVTLSEIRLGGISVRNVSAVVVPGEVLPINLLGMSFLSRLSRFEIAGGQLILVE